METMIPPHESYIFLVVDASRAMAGDKLLQVNTIMQDILGQLTEIREDDPSVQIKVAAMAYTSKCFWKSDRPLPLDEFTWSDLHATGSSDLTAMLNELCDQLDKGKMLPQTFWRSPSSISIVFAGAHSGSKGWKEAAERLDRNLWYRRAFRLALAMDDEAVDQWAKVVGSPDLVFTASGHTDDLFFAIRNGILCFYDDSDVMGEFTPPNIDDSATLGIIAPPGFDDSPTMGDFAPPDGKSFCLPTPLHDDYEHRKCRLLKSIRKAVADANNIPYEITECTFEGACSGTCPICDREAEKLSRELSKIAVTGTPIRMPDMSTAQLDDFLKGSPFFNEW